MCLLRRGFFLLDSYPLLRWTRENVPARLWATLDQVGLGNGLVVSSTDLVVSGSVLVVSGSDLVVRGSEQFHRLPFCFSDAFFPGLGILQAVSSLFCRANTFRKIMSGFEDFCVASINSSFSEHWWCVVFQDISNRLLIILEVQACSPW